MNSTSRNRKTLIGALAGLALVGGGAVAGLSAANATPTPPAPVTQPAPDNQDKSEQQEPKLNGSITVPETATEQPDAQESAQLQALATIDTKTAEAAAITSVPGSSVISSSLGDENGSLVYEVTVKDSSGTMSEVKIDAGNATVLATEAAENGDGQNAAENETGETPDAAEAPDSSEAAETGANAGR